MQNYLLIAFLFLSGVGISQTEDSITLHTLSFDTCLIVKNGAEGYDISGVFVGVGEIQFSEETITITYKNEQESGEYSIVRNSERLSHSEDGQTTLYYSGVSLNLGVCAIQVFLRQDGTIDMVLDTDFEDDAPQKRRVYQNLKSK